MKEIEVNIVTLDQMIVASAYAFSRSPEEEAYRNLRTWADSKGINQQWDWNPVFGFNNPSPKPGQSEYGYEYWLVLDEGATMAK